MLRWVVGPRYEGGEKEELGRFVLYMKVDFCKIGFLMYFVRL